MDGPPFFGCDFFQALVAKSVPKETVAHRMRTRLVTLSERGIPPPTFKQADAQLMYGIE